MHSYLFLIHTAQLRSYFSVRNFYSLSSRNTAQKFCLFDVPSTGASLEHSLPRFRTCVSVHRRDRCTRTPSSTFTALRFHCHSLCFVFSIVSPVLVCLSIDVTGALVLSLFSPCFWPVSFFLSLFWVFTCTGVSVHRRDRCTCTLLLLEFSPPFFVCLVCLLVLVCLSYLVDCGCVCPQT